MGLTFVFGLVISLLLPVGVSTVHVTDLLSVSDIIDICNKIYEYSLKENKQLEVNNEILIALSSKIDSTKQLTSAILLFLQENKIEETHMQIHSLLIDLRNIVQSKEPEISEYKRVFLERASSAIPRARFLGKHLLHVLPVMDRNIIEMLANTSRCNLTALQVLQTEVKELMLNSLLIEINVLSISNDLKFSMVKEYWEKEIADITVEFERIQSMCKSKIPELIVQDMDRCQNPKQLHYANKERYLWAWNDVFLFDNEMLGKFASYRFDYYAFSDVKAFDHNNNGMRTIVTYGTSKFNTSSMKDVLKKIGKEEDIHRLLDPRVILARIHIGLRRTELLYTTILVYFNNDNYGPLFQIDKDSQALRYDLGTIQITHCTSKLCPLNWLNWLNVDVTVTGFFTVYVALEPQENVCTKDRC